MAKAPFPVSVALASKVGTTLTLRVKRQNVRGALAGRKYYNFYVYLFLSLTHFSFYHLISWLLVLQVQNLQINTLIWGVRAKVGSFLGYKSEKVLGPCSGEPGPLKVWSTAESPGEIDSRAPDHPCRSRCPGVGGRTRNLHLKQPLHLSLCPRILDSCRLASVAVERTPLRPQRAPVFPSPELHLAVGYSCLPCLVHRGAWPRGSVGLKSSGIFSL